MCTRTPFHRIASLLVAVGLVAVPPVLAVQSAAPSTPSPAAAPTFLGQDRFDEVRTLVELRDLEHVIVQVAERLRPSVVLLRSGGRRGGVATGTAVIISKDGLLATCGHVGQTPGREVTAVLADGTELRGRTLGQYFEGGIDCGLVQLDTEGRELPEAKLGTTADLARGDWVLAMGYTHGLRGATRPALVRVGRVLRFDVDAAEGNSGRIGLFFDAPIDAGDSGGPTFNLRGEVIGLNARCGRESWQNVATPIDLLLERKETLEKQREPGGTAEPPGENTRAEAPDQPPASRRGRGGRPPRTRFPSGGGDSGKLAVERALPLGDVTAGSERSTVRISCDDRPVAYGLIVDGQGLAVTKASQLEPGTTITVEVAEHERRAAKVVAREQDMDLALLHFSVDDDEQLDAVRWAVGVSVKPGAALITPRRFAASPALGFAAIEQRESETEPIDGPLLGVQTRSSRPDELERAEANRAVTVMRVVADTGAERAGLRPGDILVAVDGTEVDSPAELRRLLGTREVGDQVRLDVVGADGARTLEAALGRRGDSSPDMRRGNTSTPISRRASGLGSLLAHDTITEPAEMGGPVVDLDGRVVGMNLARYDRTATHAIGADRMAEACDRLVEMARLAAGTDAEAGTPTIPSRNSP